MLRFSVRVRRSLAAQLIRLAWTGSAVFSFLGWVDSSGLVIAGVAVWWLALQAMAHVILAYENDSDSGSDDTS
jgi:hypothetical protein